MRTFLLIRLIVSRESQRCLGFYYGTGYGRDIDLTQALFWYRKAAAQGDQESMDYVPILAAQLGVPILAAHLGV